MSDTDRQDTINIGQKLRAARMQQQFSLRELAERAEVSASLLSKIENSKATPSVRSLHSIAEALSLPVNYFFPEKEQQKASPPESTASARQPQTPATITTVANMTPSEFREASLNKTDLGFDATSNHSKEPIVRANLRPHIELLGGIIWERLTPTAEDGVEFLQIYYEVGATSGEKMSHHSGREFQFVLEGELLLELGFESYILKAGDSIIFDSTTPHRLSNAGTTPLRAISVIFTEKNQ